MEVYHGTISSGAENIIKNGILLSKGKSKVDFGQGFYTTKSYKFAKSTAENKAAKTNIYLGTSTVYPVVLKYGIDIDKLRGLSVLKFDKENLKWAQFIVNNRNGFDYMKRIGSSFHNLEQNFDVVIGSIADNQIVLLAKELNELNEIVTEADLYKMKYLYRTNQISFHTITSLSCMKLIGCDIIHVNKLKGDVVNE